MRFYPGGGSDNGSANDNSNQRGGGKLIAGIASCSTATGTTDSMDQAYGMGELTTSRGTTPVINLKRGHDFGGASERGGVLVHISKIVERDDVVQRETRGNETDLEKGESLSHKQKSFMPEV